MNKSAKLMNLFVQINDHTFEVDFAHPQSIAIDLNFNGDQPNSYDVERARAIAYRDGEFVGSVKEGGSCNFEQYTFIPHCNGTHTECIGHLSLERISVNDVLTDLLIPATLISVVPVLPSDTSDSYIPRLEVSDEVVSKESLKLAIDNLGGWNSQALVIRTLPNDVSKKSRQYMKKMPPFFSKEAMEYIVELGVQHLLVDFPSVDRTFDEGRMTNHCAFWNTDTKDRNIDPDSASLNTITEMIYVPQEVDDGLYMLNLQIPAFVADAAPSRPLLYKYKKINKGCPK